MKNKTKIEVVYDQLLKKFKKNRVYIITDVLPQKPGGRTKSLLQRAEMLADIGYEVEILFTGYGFTHPEKIEQLYSQGIISDRITVRSVLFDLSREKTEMKKFEYEPDSNDKVEYNEFDRIKKITRHNSKGHREWMVSLDNNGVMRRRVQLEKNKFKKSEFFNSDGSVYLENTYSVVKGKAELTKTNYKNGRYKSGSKYKNNLNLWLDKVIGKQKCNVLVDVRKLDNMVMETSLPNAKINFVYHSTHYPKKNKQGIKDNYRFSMTLVKSKKYQVICLTDEQKKDIQSHEEYKGIDITVIGHPVTRLENKAPLKTSLRQNEYIIVSRLVKNKRIIDIVKAFAMFSETQPDMVLKIYGTGSEEENIIRYIQENNLSYNVKMCGYTTEANKMLQKARATIIATEYEGFGMSVLESIATGTPVISYSFKYGAKEMIVPNVNGMIAVENTPNDLANSLKLGLGLSNEHPKFYDSIQKYDLENVKVQWDELLNNK